MTYTETAIKVFECTQASEKVSELVEVDSLGVVCIELQRFGFCSRAVSTFHAQKSMTQIAVGLATTFPCQPYMPLHHRHWLPSVHCTQSSVRPLHFISFFPNYVLSLKLLSSPED